METQIWVTWENAAASLFNGASSSWLSRKHNTKQLEGSGWPLIRQRTLKTSFLQQLLLSLLSAKKSYGWEHSWLSELLLLSQPLRPSVKSKLVSRLLGEENKNADKKGPEKEPGTCTYFCVQMTFSHTAELIKKTKMYDPKCVTSTLQQDKPVLGQDLREL